MASARLDRQSLYQDDYYAWALDQAAVLRRLASEGSNVPLDLVNLAEEVADLGGSEWRAVASHAANVIEHLLKLEFSSAADPRHGWKTSILCGRDDLELAITKSLLHRLAEESPAIYRRARRRAAHGLELDRIDAAVLPLDCPYTIEQVLDQDWLPVNRHGLVE